MSFCDKLKELRKEKNWTQEELAEHIGTDKRQVSFYENDKNIPSTDTLINIAKTFNISIDYLLFDDIPCHKLYADYEFFNKLSEIEKLSEKDKRIIIDLINSLIDKSRIKELALSI